MAKITHGKILNKAKVYSNDLLGKGASIPYTTITPTEIAVHNTGNWDVPSVNYHKSLKRENGLPNGREASWHFSVDDKEIHQSIDTSKKAWHVGSGNSKAIGIEICMFKDANKQKLAEDNAIALIRELMKIHNIPVSKVKMHKDYTGKYCPQVILDRDGNLEKFKKRVSNYTAPSTSNGIPNGEVQRKAKVVVDVLNVRSGRGTNYPIIGKLYKGDIVDLYYCMDNWCSMNSKFKDANGKAVNNFICVHSNGSNYVELI